MNPTLTTVLRLLFGTVGAALLYLALFTYEDEIFRLDNALSDWWIRVYDSTTTIVPRHTAFMHKVARLCVFGFDRLFGAKYFSRRSFYVSLCYSVASFSLFAILIIEETSVAGPYLPALYAATGLDTRRDIVTLLFALAAFYGTLGSWPIFSDESDLKGWLKRVDKVALFPVLGISFLTPETLKQPALIVHAIQQPWRYLVLALLLFSFLCDTAFIAITRKTLLWCANMADFARIMSLLLINLVLATLLLLVPLSFPSLGLKILGGLNFVDVLAASASIALALGMLIHMASVPLVSRLFYVPVRHRFIHQRKLLIVMGSTFLFLAFLFKWIELVFSTAWHHSPIFPASYPCEIAFLALQIFQVMFLWLHDWIPLGKLNDVVAVRRQYPPARLAKITLIQSLPFTIGLGLSLGHFGHPYPHWLYEWLWISYGILFLGQIRAWWIPYLVSTEPERTDRYRAMFGSTHAFLPERHGIVPNTAHILLHLATAATLLLLFI